MVTVEFGGMKLYFIVLVAVVISILLGEDFFRQFECYLNFS